MTSGGDAPGMNTHIRSLVRYALEQGIEIFGIEEGYQGMIQNKIYAMDYDSVCNIVHKGGTILKTSRSPEFMTPEGRLKAAANLDALGIQALVCCGGNGSYLGLKSFANKDDGQWSGQVIGTPGTIDNDIEHTDYTIGYDTAVNTVVEAVDKLRDTGDSHHMHFIVEVMGRHCGDIARSAGIASGATFTLVPETKSDVEAVYQALRQKGHDIILVAEGDETGGAIPLSKALEERYAQDHPGDPHSFRVCILGHTQRGGTPSARDRIMAHHIAIKAIDSLKSGESMKAVAWKAGDLILTEL